MRQTLEAAQERLSAHIPGVKPPPRAMVRHNPGRHFATARRTPPGGAHLRRAAALRSRSSRPRSRKHPEQPEQPRPAPERLLGKHRAVPLLRGGSRRRSATSSAIIQRLVGMDNLASAYRAAGKFGTIPLYKETLLEPRTAVLGPDHLHTLTTMNGLARPLPIDHTPEAGTGHPPVRRGSEAGEGSCRKAIR